MRKNKTLLIIISVLIALLSLSFLPNISLGADPYVLEPYARIALKASGTSAYQYVDRLTKDDFEARLSGSEGCNKAADYIADEFSTIGLTPFRNDSYFQALEVPYFNLMPPFQFKFQTNKVWEHPLYRQDFIVFHYSGRGKVSNKCVFIGYGINAPKLKYNDYEGISVTNKTALMLVGLPSFLQNKSDAVSIYNRIDMAFSYGASSVVLLSGSAEDIPFRFDRKMAIGFDAKIPVIIAHPDLSRTLIQPFPQTLDDVIQSIEDTHKPNSFLVGNVMEIEINFVMEQRISSNVVGYIPAIDPTVKESILITSHYDGLGIDYLENAMYQGANDNASSTGCVMEIARILKQSNILPAINIVFIAFTGEEVGLYGSYHYTRNPLFPLSKIVAVLNMEEVGTFDGINIMGTDRSIYPELGKMIYNSAKLLKTKVSFYPELLYPGSDHWPFHERGVPSVCFARLPLPNGYPEYHKRSDTIDIISPKSLEIFCQLVALMTLSYTKVAYFDFTNFPTTNQINHPFVIYDVPSYIPENNNLSINVNQQKMDTFITNQLAFFIPLQKQENRIVIEIKFKNKTWIKKTVTLQRPQNLNPNLRADFNLDFRIDATDLTLLSKKLDKPANQYSIDSLYDLNQNGSIDLYDYALFQDYFG